MGTTLDVEKYLVQMNSGQEGNNGVLTTVYLFPRGGDTVHLQFYPDSVLLPPNKVSAHRLGHKLYYARYHYSQLSDMIDILRNEEPIRFFYREDTHAAYVATGREDVGEADG